MIDQSAIKAIVGHVKISDKQTGDVLVDKDNAVNFEAMSLTIANGLAGNPTGVIQLMVFGNGGTTVSGSGVITYFPPNVTGLSAQLYDETYSKVVNSNSPLNLDPTDNYIQTVHVAGNNYTDLVITCTLEYDEPAGEQPFDNATVVGVSTSAGEYIFDEIGLKAFAQTGEGILLTHVIFHPIQKSLNRQLEIIYTLRILLS